MGVGEGGVRKATPADAPAIADALAHAFFDGPITMWHVPDEGRRLDVMSDFFTVLLELVYLRFGLVHTNVGAVAGGAMCMDPAKGAPPEASADLDRALAKVFRDFPRTLQIFELLDSHHPQEPHYYLQFMGVRPERQGEGIGSALLRVVLNRCDLEGAPLYLEADDRSKALYLKHGFEVTAELALPDGPSFWPMWRVPRGRPISE